MNTLRLNQAEQKKGPRFWSRQFSSNVTSPQKVFDVVVGVVAPVLCFICDPIVFRNNLGFTPFNLDLSPFQLPVYFFSGLSILTLLLWLKLRNRSGELSAVIAGILLAGSVGSLIIGIVILPLTMFGLLVLIGILGFTPFVVSFVYLRNAIRAFKNAKPLITRPQLMTSFLLGAILVSGPPTVAHWQIRRMVTQSMNDLLTGDVQTAEWATQRLRYVGWAADLDQVVWTYSREADQTRKAALAKAYKEITGKDITTRLMILLD